LNALVPYSIPVKGLSNGVHLFDFQIDNSFFELFEGSPISEGNFEVRISFDKRPDLYVLLFEFAGHIKSDCDRCLESIQLPVAGKEQLLVKITELELEEEADVIYLSSFVHELNVAKYIYEYICLAIPMHRVYDCEKDEKAPCNVDILKYINGATDTTIDPGTEERENPFWTALKDKFKDN
jgi:uncharacterized metal-binding protein YceD (DUF177 family)